MRKTDSSNPVDWLIYIDADIEGLDLLVENRVSPLICQSKLAEVFEKIMKAELIRMGWFLEKTHDLQKLAVELQKMGAEWVTSEAFKELVNDLSEKYVVGRYPGFDYEEPDWTLMNKQLIMLKDMAEELRKSLDVSGENR